MSDPTHFFAVQTARGVPGGVGVLALWSSDLDAALRSIGLACEPGGVRLVDLLGIDAGLIVRADGACAYVTPHGGPAVMAQLERALLARGFESGDVAPWPEAAGEAQAGALRAVAASESPLALRVLLRQAPATGAVSEPPEVARARARLLRPPTVAAIGPANVGKSSLLNALAGTGVSVVSEEPGTTRDHVGVTLTLDGLAVRYLDTPGTRADAPAVEARAMAWSLEAVRGADLLLLCADAGSSPPMPPGTGGPWLRVALRRDLGEAAWDHDVSVSVHDRASVGVLAKRIRRELAPDALIFHESPWAPGVIAGSPAGPGSVSSRP